MSAYIDSLKYRIDEQEKMAGFFLEDAAKLEVRVARDDLTEVEKRADFPFLIKCWKNKAKSILDEIAPDKKRYERLIRVATADHTYLFCEILARIDSLEQEVERLEDKCNGRENE